MDADANGNDGRTTKNTKGTEDDGEFAVAVCRRRSLDVRRWMFDVGCSGLCLRDRALGPAHRPSAVRAAPGFPENHLMRARARSIIAR